MTRRSAGGAERVGAAVTVLAAMAFATGCSSAPAGLGRRACPYLRPRLVRLDRDRTALPTDPAAAADVASVAQDIALYVQQLPAGGRSRADQPLVRFSAALDRFAVAPPATGSATNLQAPERSIKRVCGVSRG